VAICTQEGNAVSRLGSVAKQGTGKKRNALGKLRIRESLLSAYHSNFIGKLLTRVAQKTNGREGNLHVRLAIRWRGQEKIIHSGKGLPSTVTATVAQHRATGRAAGDHVMERK
jgi:hypothetical protein